MENFEILAGDLEANLGRVLWGHRKEFPLMMPCDLRHQWCLWRQKWI